jgi:hypothetical protein
MAFLSAIVGLALYGVVFGILWKVFTHM